MVGHHGTKPPWLVKRQDASLDCEVTRSLPSCSTPEADSPCNSVTLVVAETLIYMNIGNVSNYMHWLYSLLYSTCTLALCSSTLEPCSHVVRHVPCNSLGRGTVLELLPKNLQLMTFLQGLWLVPVEPCSELFWHILRQYAC